MYSVLWSGASPAIKRAMHCRIFRVNHFSVNVSHQFPRFQDGWMKWWIYHSSAGGCSAHQKYLRRKFHLCSTLCCASKHLWAGCSSQSDGAETDAACSVAQEQSLLLGLYFIIGLPGQVIKSGALPPVFATETVRFCHLFAPYYR